MKRFAILSLLFAILTANAYSQAKQFLCIDITPTDATLEINGEVKQTKNGVYRELVPLGKYQCKVYQDGYYTESREIEITDPFNTYRTSVSLPLIIGYLTIQTYRENSDHAEESWSWDESWEVFVDDEYFGTLPLKKARVQCGSHSLTLKHPHYKTYNTTFDITENDVLILTPTLERTAVSMSLKTYRDTDIYIDDIYIGKGIWNGIFHIGQTYKFETRKPGMASEPLFYTITDADHSRTFYLPDPSPLLGSILVSSNVPNGSISVYIDGKGPYLTSDLGKIPVGEHTIYVVANKDNPYNYYKSQVKTVTVNTKQETAVEFDIPLVPMNIVSNLPYAKIYVDNHPINSENPYVKLGNHTVTLFYQEGFFNEQHTATETVNIEEGANNEVVFDIDIPHGSLIITSNSSTSNLSVQCHDSNGEIVFDFWRKTPIYIPIIKPGKYTFTTYLKDSTEQCAWQTRTVEISQGELVELDFHEAYGSLKITSEPDSARVYLLGTYRGITPFVLDEFPVGDYNVAVEYPNGQYAQKRITIYDNTLTEYEFIRSDDDIYLIDLGKELIDFSLDNIETEIKDIPIVIEKFKFDLEDDEDFEITIMDYQEEVIEECDKYDDPIPFQLVEEKPSFQGGDANQFAKWVNSRLVYPENAKKNGVQGRVILQLTIAKDGRITNVKVLRGVDPSLDKEAVRVVSSSPKWTPGKQRDRAVPVTYTFPVIFQLR